MPILSNPHWEAYAVSRAEGLSQRQAYRKAYPDSKCSDTTADRKACDLEKEGKIRARYEEIRGKVEDDAVLTRKEKRELLANMARNTELPVSDRQRAIDLDNKMEDEYVTRVEGSIGVVKLEDLL